MATAGELLDRLFADFPEETAEDYDNVGLLVGSRSDEVRRVLCALDMNAEVALEAINGGFDAVVTHHPVMFRGRKRLTDDDYEGRLLRMLIKGGLSHIAMHTNYDFAPEGVNRALAAALGCAGAEALEGGMCVCGFDPMSLEELAILVKERLGGVVRRYGEPDRMIGRACVMGGSGDSFAAEALKTGADVFITGEIGYHTALDTLNTGMAVLEAGHAATEYPAVRALADRINSFDIGVIAEVSEYRPYL